MNTNLVVIYFAPCSAGHLLANCLSLADNAATLEHWMFVDKFDVAKKIQYYLAKMNNVNEGDNWNDLGQPDQYTGMERERYPNSEETLGPLVAQGINFFTTTHYIEKIKEYNEEYNIKALVRIEPHSAFVANRTKTNKHNECVPSGRGMELKDTTHLDIPTVTWDPRSLMSTEYTHTLEELYKQLELTPFHAEHIASYVQLWKSKTFNI